MASLCSWLLWNCNLLNALWPVGRSWFVVLVKAQARQREKYLGSFVDQVAYITWLINQEMAGVRHKTLGMGMLIIVSLLSITRAGDSFPSLTSRSFINFLRKIYLPLFLFQLFFFFFCLVRSALKTDHELTLRETNYRDFALLDHHQ